MSLEFIRKKLSNLLEKRKRKECHKFIKKKATKFLLKKDPKKNTRKRPQSSTVITAIIIWL